MIKENGDTFSLEVETVVKAPIEEAWSCFMDPKKSAEFFFGISFESDLVVGHPITWRGEWQGKSFVDTGVILELREPRLFRYDYKSSLSGPDGGYEVAYSFEPFGGGTRIAIKQSRAVSRESAEHSEKNWSMMLAAVKEKLER
jgi:uncharacterized protein YndB with AHSA1/START domain